MMIDDNDEGNGLAPLLGNVSNTVSLEDDVEQQNEEISSQENVAATAPLLSAEQPESDEQRRQIFSDSSRSKYMQASLAEQINLTRDVAETNDTESSRFDFLTAAIVVAVLWIFLISVSYVFSLLSYIFHPLGCVGLILLQQRIEDFYKTQLPIAANNSSKIYQLLRLLLEKLLVFDRDAVTIPWLIGGFLIISFLGPTSEFLFDLLQILTIIFYTCSVLWIGSRRILIVRLEIIRLQRQAERYPSARTFPLSNKLIHSVGIVLFCSTFIGSVLYGGLDNMDAQEIAYTIIGVCLFAGAIALMSHAGQSIRQHYQQQNPVVTGPERAGRINEGTDQSRDTAE